MRCIEKILAPESESGFGFPELSDNLAGFPKATITQLEYELSAAIIDLKRTLA